MIRSGFGSDSPKLGTLEQGEMIQAVESRINCEGSCSCVRAYARARVCVFVCVLWGGALPALHWALSTEWRARGLGRHRSEWANTRALRTHGGGQVCAATSIDRALD